MLRLNRLAFSAAPLRLVKHPVFSLSRPMHTAASSSSSSSLTGLRLLGGAGAAAGVFALGMIGAATTDGVTVSMGDSPAKFWPDYVRQRVRSTYAVFGGGIAFTAASVVVFFRSGAVHAMAGVNPWVLTAALLGGSLASMFAIYTVPKENTFLKVAAYGAFTGLTGLSLAPLAMLGGPIVLKAAVYTAGILGSLSWVAMNSPSDEFLWMRGPLAIGLGAVCIASVGSMFLPASAAGMAANVSLYLGIPVFSAFMLYDTSKLLTHAHNLPEEQFDAFRESIGIYLNTINLFVRMATLLAGNKRK